MQKDGRLRRTDVYLTVQTELMASDDLKQLGRTARTTAVPGCWLEGRLTAMLYAEEPTIVGDLLYPFG